MYVLKRKFNHDVDDDGHGPLTVFRATCISKIVYFMLLPVLEFQTDCYLVGEYWE